MVLVILAILAAILVPALLGWIDSAKEKQYVLDARNVYMATQAVLDEKYAGYDQTAEHVFTNEFAKFDSTANNTTECQRIKDLSEVEFTSISIDDWVDRLEDSAGEANPTAGIKTMTITDIRGEVGTNAILEEGGTWTISKS